MSFTINPRVLSVLSLAVVSVAGQWTGAYNTTEVSSKLDPAPKCWIKGFAKRPYSAVYPCTCWSGKVAADCNWASTGVTYNAVRNAECKCGTEKKMLVEPKGLKQYSSKKNAVTRCACDPPEKEEPDADGLIVPARECWCPFEGLKENSGLKEAKEGEAIMEEPVVDPAVQKCSTELDNSTIVKPNLCAELKKTEPTEMTKGMQAQIPSCTMAHLIEICKNN
ncbi:hypothetical protein MY10362_009655 [Beauveria mimosiformis]